MKSTRPAARSRPVGHRPDTLRQLVIAPIVCLGRLMVCAAPLLFLYWLYRPTVLPNPGLGALKEPVAMALLPPASQPDSREDVEISSQAPLADVAEDSQEPEPADRKPKSAPGTRTLHRIAGRRNLRFADNVRKPAPTYNVSAALTNPGGYIGMSPGAASAYAYVVEQSGRHRW